MIRFLPILIALVVGIVMYRLSVTRTRRELDANSTELVDPQLDAVTGKMAEVIGVPRIKVNIYEIEPINGLADADGRIFITRGFYRKFRSGEVSAEELASVIAHEMGHVALGHAKKRAIDFSGQNALRTALAMMLSRFIPFIGGYIAAGLVSLLTARLSRNDEYEADAYATALLIKSGIGAGPQKTMFEKLEVMTGAAGSAMPAWLIGHPKPKQRIEAITKNEAKWS